MREALLASIKKQNRPEYETMRRVVVTAAKDSWNEAEKNLNLHLLEDISRALGGTAWRDGWKPIFDSVRILNDEKDYSSTYAIGVHMDVQRSDTHKQRLYDLLSLCRDLAEENAKLKQSFWYRASRVLLIRVW
jgi:hypothetical protein